MFGQLVHESSEQPVRKRRRPALSCIECRRRKIKCDRNLPCNHCSQVKNSPCVYKNLHSPNTTSHRLSPSKATSTQTHTRQIPGTLVADIPDDDDCPYMLPSQGSSPQTAPVRNDSSSEQESYTSPATTIDDSHPTTILVERFRRPELTLPDGMNATDEEIKGTKWQKALGLSYATFNDIIVEDGDPGAKLRTKFFNQTDVTPIKELRGCMSKTRFFGQSHWMNSFEHFYRLDAFKDSVSVDDVCVAEANAEVRRLLEKCKTEARKIKAERSVKWHTDPDPKNYMPPRGTSDHLVQLYLRTMESTHRILHIPQFLREYEAYWADPNKASDSTIVKILLVMAIGACFYQEPDYESIHSSALQWVYCAHSWVSAPFEKGRLNLSGLQIHCLLILARQTTQLGGDLMWVACGTLLRCAFQMGYHRDPKWFPKLSVMHAELRRRLWATVLEMVVQASLDTGMPPLITANDFDTEPPSNVNDEEISESTLVLPNPKPMSVYTQSSIQIQLLKSLQTRLLVSNRVNDFHTEVTYEEALALGSEIAKACRENSLLIQSYPLTLPHPTQLQRIIADTVVRRFVLAIHRPFSMKSRSEPRYYFSRKTCVDSVMVMLSHFCREKPASLDVNPSAGEYMDDFTRLCCVGGGFYKEIIVQSGVLICSEVILQIEEDITAGIPVISSTTATRQPLIKVLDDLGELLKKRMELGESNAKGLMFLAAARGQIEALLTGARVDKTIIEYARDSARVCLEILRARTKTPSTPANASVTNPTTWQPGVYNTNQDMEYDLFMQDGTEGNSMSNFNFDIPDSWLFAGWGDNNMAAD